VNAHLARIFGLHGLAIFIDLRTTPPTISDLNNIPRGFLIVIGVDGKATTRKVNYDKGEDLGQILAGEAARIVIRGHAFAESNAGGDSADDLRALSFARADAIATVFEKSGVESSRIRVEACGDAEPLSQSPPSEIARAQNRRVEIEIRPDTFAPSGNEDFPNPTR